MDLDDILSQLDNDVERQISSVSNMQFGYSASLQTSSATEQDKDLGEKFMFCPECGTKLAVGSRFCSNCGTKVETDDVEGDYDECSCSQGIIMTDTVVLSKKYSISRQDVIEALSEFSRKSEKYGVDWRILDVSDYRKELGECTWMDYGDVLQHFIKENNLRPCPRLSLFIVGGNDIIPQPAEKNPCGDPSDEYEELVYADFYYCFSGKLPLEFLDFNKARCNVGRLPLEMGKIKNSTFEDDIVHYLDESLKIMDNGGISIGNAVMTSNVDWIPASREMSRNLPTPHMDDTDGETLDNMYLSPGVMAEHMNAQLEKKYYTSLSDADMLVFNLHGACSPEDSGFYSSGLAFSIDMLKKSNAKIFNTVACWGGRYIKYKRKDSMLLNAIYNNGVMLYSGSCVPALGKCGSYQWDSTWRIQPAAYSETFMSRYAEYQCIGKMTAGEAFLKAKCDYYNSSRSIEEDEYTLGTVLMFNLYGCPLLKTKPNVNAIEEMQEDDGSKVFSVPFRRMQKKVVLKGNDNVHKDLSAASLLDEIRSAVDSNLVAIHDIVQKNLYDVLGVQPRELYSVEKYSSTDEYGNAVSGFLYNYRRQKGCIRTDIRAKVDELGNLIDAIQTK